MADKELLDLKAMADALTKPTIEIGGRRAYLDEIVGESYVKELATMSEAEAVEHLRSASGEKLLHAYLVLSTRSNYALRGNHPVLAEVCLRLIASTKASDRMMGAGDLGSWLVGTNDRNASHVLALTICNRDETDAVKSEAYASLELINNRKTLLECARSKWQAKDSQVGLTSAIDWEFVRSFL